ncbi:MAG TPA: DUF1990 domain-containing protein [Acidimicrobiales bacterium]
MFLLGRPSPDRLARILAAVEDAALTYDEVGATRHAGELPPGYHHVRERRELGAGDAAFRAAADGLRTWQLHRRQGFVVVPADPPIAAGTVVASAIPLPAPGVHVVAACRIVWVVDEPDRFGFGYGTLPAHPASGEEAFVVERDAAGRVALAITAFSSPRHPLVRLGAPVARWQQARATRGYFDALAAHVAAAR